MTASRCVSRDPGIEGGDGWLRGDRQQSVVILAGTEYIVVSMTPAQIKHRKDFAIQQNITTLRKRVDELGVSEPMVTRQGNDRIGVQLPGVDDPNQAIRILGATATLEFRLVDETSDPYEAQRTKRVPIASRLYKHSDGTPILLKREIDRLRGSADRCDHGVRRSGRGSQRATG